ncbi:MAG: MBL fold metallo-hydrolase [Bacteroidetes bacterium]|nr:MBL fold metallo-hydrolase [Bacteroidota bacterium]
MKLTFWGAARQVTGSKHLAELEDGTRILIDCGLDYEKKNEFDERNARFPFDPASIDLLILTHAHIDHSGNVPNLIRQGFTGPILCTRPTMELSDFLLQDSLNIQRMELQSRQRAMKKKGGKKHRHGRQAAEAQPLYLKKHIMDMMDQCRVLEFGNSYKYNDALTVEFAEAGHILGAASVVLTVTEENRKIRVGFTGDLGNYSTKLVNDPAEMHGLDYLVSESTYGGRNHNSHGSDACNVLLRHVEDTCVSKGGKLVIPAFSVGRTQAILFAFHQLYREGKLPAVRIFTDSPLAIRSTSVYQHNMECMNDEAAAFQKKWGSLFDFPLLQVVEDMHESELLSTLDEPCVIISAAGMVEGGRIQMHVRNNIGIANNSVLIAGFCADGTLGHRLLQGQDFVEINFKKRPVRADIFRTDAFSAHPDHDQLLGYIRGTHKKGALKGVFLVHGDPAQMEKLAADLSNMEVHMPAAGQSFTL